MIGVPSPPSFPRRRESRLGDGAFLSTDLRVWIPACAGMTHGVSGSRHPPRFIVSRAMMTCWIWLVPS
ncbi:hypothetical protein DC429_08940 [Arthrobacter sp. TPD3018]|nr:hypothetical protein DC425_09070 [Sphingomonas sp. TPD3009]PVE58428.1 hypothetical protein DC429_08940 [Arthrobacter sp. TPD3018]PVE87815.1 hypothetical protein DC431_04245 [Sphingomonas melonis]